LEEILGDVEEKYNHLETEEEMKSVEEAFNQDLVAGIREKSVELEDQFEDETHELIDTIQKFEEVEKYLIDYFCFF